VRANFANRQLEVNLESLGERAERGILGKKKGPSSPGKRHPVFRKILYQRLKMSEQGGGKAPLMTTLKNMGQ